MPIHVIPAKILIYTVHYFMTHDSIIHDTCIDFILCNNMYMHACTVCILCTNVFTYLQCLVILHNRIVVCICTMYEVVTCAWIYIMNLWMYIHMYVTYIYMHIFVCCFYVHTHTQHIIWCIIMMWYGWLSGITVVSS